MDVPGRLGPRADLRVGDTDRQRVVAELQRHFVDGRLTSDELGERVDQALRSKTFGELALLTADLPSLAIQPSSPDLLQSESAHLGFGIPIGAMLLLIGLMSMLWMFAVPGGHHPGGFFGFWPIFIWGFFLIGRPARRDRRDHSQGGDPPTRYQ